MGDENQFLFGLRHLGSFSSPCLEVGSRNTGHTVSFRTELGGRGETYLGIDREPGDGVDKVIDLTADFARITDVLPLSFNTIICLSVLEHTPQPFKMAGNLQRLLAPGGTIFVSVPFSWEIHEYPKDYWRFTPDGVRALFPSIDFPDSSCAYHSSRRNIFPPLAAGPPRVELLFNEARNRHGLLQAVVFVMARKCGLFPLSLRHSYLLAPVMLNMIGRKK
jgi:hypothetical protein